MRLNSLSLPKKFSIKCRHLYISSSMARGFARRMLGDDDFGAARVEIGDDAVAIERLVGDQRAESDALKERRNRNRIETLSGHEREAHEIAERIGERQDFGGHAAF